MELAKRGAELLFQALTERKEKIAIAIAINDLRLDKKTLTERRLRAAIR